MSIYSRLLPSPFRSCINNAKPQGSTDTDTSYNGLIQIHDLRKISSPCSSILAHSSGISSASFQAHSGLMATSSYIPHLTSSPPIASGQREVSLGIYRSNLSTLSPVTCDTISYASSSPFQPYVVMHNLRPFLGLGFGTKCALRGSGLGKGDDTDSGSYSFLRSQVQRAQRVNMAA